MIRLYRCLYILWGWMVRDTLEFDSFIYTYSKTRTWSSVCGCTCVRVCLWTLFASALQSNYASVCTCVCLCNCLFQGRQWPEVFCVWTSRVVGFNQAAFISETQQSLSSPFNSPHTPLLPLCSPLLCSLPPFRLFFSFPCCCYFLSLWMEKASLPLSLPPPLSLPHLYPSLSLFLSVQQCHKNSSVLRSCIIAIMSWVCCPWF